MKLTKLQLKDIGIRTLKTAIVAAFTAFFGSVTLIVFTDIDSLKIAIYNAAMTAGTAAGTAILNIGIKLFNGWIDDRKLTQEEIDEALGGNTKNQNTGFVLPKITIEQEETIDVENI